ncbi:DedA family protein [Apibacter muscae]|uniref:YqaA family protein n=1 Tax=Apibacter muscae TaxID=2509004 RepID=UPI0011AC2FAE|nr:YqaA family protein [Apibacter muscae]TWP24107.1 DedA family protein [Apibacter muscae]TWP29515.1 DedA family protein [Apibacter muscae]
MLDALMQYGYVGLFIASFLSATILPFSSEAVLLGILALGGNSWICILLATLGNTLGGLTNYFLGKMGKMVWIEKYLKVKKEKLEKMQQWLEKKGASMAFFSFLPIVGDTIPLALGYMRANIYIVTVFMLLGKFLRYLVVFYGYKFLQ